MSTQPRNPQDKSALEPLSDVLVECIHCGLCLEACPTYVELGKEEDSPRGRIYLMRSVSEGSIDLNSSVVNHLDICLGCRACETACPSGVKYGFLLEHTRSYIEQAGKRPMLESLGRRTLLKVFTNPALMALAMTLATLPSRLMRRRPKAPSGIISRIMGSEHSGGALHLGAYPKLYPDKLPERTYPKSQPRLKVALLEGCVMPTLFPEVNRATVNVLSKLGCEVVVPKGQGCCGALHLHNGLKTDARRMAKKNIYAFSSADCDYVVVNSAGCGSAMKEYHLLFEPGTPDYDAAREFASKVRDVSELIEELLPGAEMSPVNETVTYHDACHLAHGQKVRSQPRSVLNAIPGLSLIPLRESDHCCGSAGVYSFTQPRLAADLRQRKIGNIEATGAHIVATGNPGCQMWIRSGLIEKGSSVQALHPIEILERALK